MRTSNALSSSTISTDVAQWNASPPRDAGSRASRVRAEMWKGWLIMQATTLSRLRQLSDLVNAITIAFCAALLLAMMLVSATGIVIDLAYSGICYFTGFDPLTNEVARWAHANSRPSVVRVFLPWFGMLSITVAFKYCEHVAIDVFSSSLPQPALRIVKAVNFIAIALFGAALAWYGLELAIAANRQFIVSESLQLSQRWTVSAVPVAGFIICIHLFDGFALLDERNASKGELPSEIEGPFKAGEASR